MLKSMTVCDLFAVGRSTSPVFDTLASLVCATHCLYRFYLALQMSLFVCCELVAAPGVICMPSECELCCLL